MPFAKAKFTFTIRESDVFGTGGNTAEILQIKFADLR